MLFHGPTAVPPLPGAVGDRGTGQSPALQRCVQPTNLPEEPRKRGWESLFTRSRVGMLFGQRTLMRAAAGARGDAKQKSKQLLILLLSHFSGPAARCQRPVARPHPLPHGRGSFEAPTPPSPGHRGSGTRRLSSRSWASSTGAGAWVSRSAPFWVLGKAMTSRMLVVPTRCMTMRSMPKAMPAVGRGAVGEGVEEEAELGPGFFLVDAEDFEGLLLDVGCGGYGSTRRRARCR